MRSMLSGCCPFKCCLWIVVLAAASAVEPAVAELITIDFEQFSIGQVVAGETPDGGTANPNLFPYVTFSIDASGRGAPNSLVIFDSADPSGGDYDLGTPNHDFGGPGLGLGGASGAEGENAIALYSIVVIGENIRDVSPPDGLVDEPDDNTKGGTITATFDFGVTVDHITLVDIDSYSRGSWIKLYTGDTEITKHNLALLGNNSVQEVDLAAYEDVTSVVIRFRGSGGIDNFSFRISPTATDETTWGAIKNKYR